MLEEKPIKIVPICDGEFHLKNEISSNKCRICERDKDNDMALLRGEDNKFYFACFEHDGIIQEFVRQYKRVPIGWDYIQKENQDEVGPPLGTLP